MGDLKFQIQHYATELWRRKWSILLVGLLVGLLGTYVAATRPDVFTSRAAVEVDENALLNAVLPRGAPRTNTSAAIDSVRRGIYARPNLEQIIYDTDLNLTLNDRRGMEALVLNLEEKLELKRQGTNYYVIEYTHNDPVVARDVTQAALDIFLEKSIQDTGSGQGTDKEEARSFLQTKLDDSNERLAEVQAKIAAYQRDNGDAIRGTNAVQNQLRGLESQLSSLRSDRLLYQGELSNLQSRLASTPPEIITRYIQPPQQVRQQTPPPIRPNVVVPQTGPTPEQNRADAYQRQLGALQSELATMLERLTPQHPDVVTMQNRLNAAQGDFAQLDAAARAASARQQAEVNRANQILTDYENNFRQWQIQNSQPIAQLPQQPVYGPNPAVAEIRAQANSRRSRINVVDTEIAQLNEEIRQVRDVMAKQPEIVQQFTKLSNAETKLLNEVGALENQLDVIQPSIIQSVRMKVVEPPLAPVTPAGPNRLLLFMGAFLLAGGSGLGLAFMRVQLADNIPTIKHLKSSFDLPILGGVSKMESQADIAKNAASNLIFLACVAALIALFGYVTYRFHFELWRPDFAGALAKVGIAPTPGG
jgi:polysaccharide chain length determinant protein (PEP-CTERM system associated)